MNNVEPSTEQSVQCNPTDSKRRASISWDDYFMGVALLSAKRSKDPVTRVGACIVDENNVIVGVGYNGMPRNCSDDVFPWEKNSNDELNNKKLYVCHAEINAILNRNLSKLKGCKMYVSLFPCNECAKVIIQSGIKKIYYISDKNKNKIDTKASKIMLDAAKVVYESFTPRKTKIVIDFDDFNYGSSLNNSVSNLNISESVDNETN
ncbi:PREDICTED: deoxycytidylate deaminase [Polistes dominula]|uniref:dCMP deaminase n=1 Tax=Polistes dominula TaxID=743375 RepID=A0ABM1I9E0_POLDO|nr:PREDICTED: deoxycytidylate deaminase [Polistes dominula]